LCLVTLTGRSNLGPRSAAINPVVGYDADPHLAEIYDATETQLDDLALIRRLVAGRGPLKVLEPFCGTGRLLLPLAEDGHTVVGLDGARAMLARAHAKARALPEAAQARVKLRRADVVASTWPEGFDLVLLGGNCLYELATPEEQALCLARAARALRPGGFVYVDNNHMEGELDPSWRRPGEYPSVYPTGTCADGTQVQGFTETVWFDAPKRLVRFARRIVVTPEEGEPREYSYQQQKHPVSTGEVRAWLEASGLVIEEHYGARDASPYTVASQRSIFWARRPY
jgi:SAM-dependent methyltransferase